jgi:hypothetical protein
MIARTAVIHAVAALMLCGCVERKMVITSEPAGAVVYVSQEEIGRTPVELPFTWYGDYDITLRLDGYQTRNAGANLRMPAYEIPPLDLFSELAPWTYRDTRYLHYSLSPLAPTSDAQLIQQAQDMAAQVQTPVKP